MYPDKKEILIENFPLHKNKILELGKINSSNLKDNTLKCIINEYLSLSSGIVEFNCVIQLFYFESILSQYFLLIPRFLASEEASHLAALLILPFLLSPITAKRKKGKAAWRPSKLEMKDGFITHIKSHTELQDTVSRRKDKYSKLGVTLQPLIIIVGPNCNEISQYFILVDDTYYVMNSILTALDCCFKIIHALNLQYPYESLPVWMFIQKGFYEIETLWDTEYVCVNSLLSDLSIIESSQHNK